MGMPSRRATASTPPTSRMLRWAPETTQGAAPARRVLSHLSCTASPAVQSSGTFASEFTPVAFGYRLRFFHTRFSVRVRLEVYQHAFQARFGIHRLTADGSKVHLTILV